MRFMFDERVLRAGGERVAPRVVRRVTQAAAAINGQVRTMEAVLRPEVSLLVAELRDGVVTTYSPGGPLTRSELELIEGPGDPLALPALLSAKAVSVGDRWAVGTAAARSLTSYDALAVNGLEARLESLDEGEARVKLEGTVRGAVLGGEGQVAITGECRFDRKAGRVSRLAVDRTEKRQAGPVEAGLDITSRLVVERQPLEVPPELADAALKELPQTPAPGLELLEYRAPDGRYMFLHDRDWHLFADDVRQTVLKRLDHGETVAQCNLAAGPHAGKGRHQDLGQFRDDIRRALGRRFGRVIEADELEGPPGTGFRYRVAVAGKEGEVGVLWYYYLLASPAGDQLLVTFTLGEAQARQFADQDLRLIGSVQWVEPAAANTPRPGSD
jgi:hypothetical protein